MDKNLDNNHEENLKRGQALLNHLEEMQYSYFNGRPEWIPLQKNDLKLFIAHIYYGYPYPSNAIVENNYEHEINSEELFKLYKNEIKKKILDIYELIEEKYINPSLFSNIEVGITIVHSICKKKCDTCQHFPKKDIHKWLLLRLKVISNKFIFIDFQNNRTYTGWDEYMENNNLPEGYMFYPNSGFYDASKTLYQTITPASKTTETVFKTADIASYILNSVGGIVFACGSFFLLGTPIGIGLAVTGSALTTVSSSYQFGRHVQQLIDMFHHDINKSDTNSWKRWIGLSISAIGVIMAPFQAVAAIKSDVNSTIQSTGRALTILRTACVTQCTLVVFHAALDFRDNNFKITWKSVINLRIDLFVVTGVLMPPSFITDILKLLAKQAVWVPIYKTIEQIPYCLGQYVWNSVYFFKNHFTMFVESVTKFLAENLTSSNLLFAWKTIRCMFDGYQKQTSNLDVDDLLWHVVDGIAINKSVKYVLRGQHMVNLLDSLRVYAPKKRISRALVKYCVDHVLEEAKKLSALRDDCVAEIARHGETRAWKVDEEFCKCYGLGRCAMDQYALWAIGQVNAATLMAEYEKHTSRPENMFNDDMVFNKRDDAGWSTKGYSFVAPCGVLDLEMCLRFAEKINPQPHRYLNHELVQPEPAVSLMFGVSAYSVNIVFFGIDLINGVPKMSICFFEENRDPGSSVANHKGFKKLQAA
ncbi:uncharacterized protein LOC100573401 [Acyrthosiphon pisum]|uniref:DUF4781 domain-containing protein n=1 Tax=Acyrthosiphon pisum TaxID=7029 RepID=A0A8R2AB18_ACYPI|nr:uncharacterized protein LOC100573401 [Acyrthosiphon pisum]|eukprot:XP_003247765.1 PREDICTED: uncharacterized protein LOC100573401 [Acyrthosiphon pisum]